MIDNIILLTDFGNSSSYVGIIHGVIKSINPDVNIIDLTHQVTPQSIIEANYILKSSYHYFPKNSIFVSVIDPTVGSDRNIILIKTEDYSFIAPNNGLLTNIIDDFTNSEIIEVSNNLYFLENISNTFHGRDVFAPVAAHFSNGTKFDKFGKKLLEEDIIKKNFEPKIIKTNHNDKIIIIGQVIHIDSYGNCITNITKEKYPNIKSIRLENKSLTYEKIYSTFSDVDIDEDLIYWGSTGRIELSVNNGNFANKYDITLKTNIIAIIE